MALPPCVLQTDLAKHMFQTYVVKVLGADPRVLRTEGQARISTCRAHAAASIEVITGL